MNAPGLAWIGRLSIGSISVDMTVGNEARWHLGAITMAGMGKPQKSVKKCRTLLSRQKSKARIMPMRLEKPGMHHPSSVARTNWQVACRTKFGHLLKPGALMKISWLKSMRRGLLGLSFLGRKKRTTMPMRNIFYRSGTY